jgi:hypothetical protein
MERLSTFAAAFGKTFFEAPSERGVKVGSAREVEKVFQQTLAGKSKDTTFAVPLAEMSATEERR